MNPFRVIAKVVTVPAHEVRNGVRLVQIEQSASDALDLLDAAAKDPTLYRSPTWWEHALIAAQRVYRLMPLPDTGRRTMNNWLKKLAMVAGGVASIAGAAKDVPFVPAEYQPLVAAVGTLAAAVAGLYHPAPGSIAQP